MVGVSMEEMRLFICLLACFFFFPIVGGSGVKLMHTWKEGRNYTHTQYHLASANITSEYGVTEENFGNRIS